MGWIGMDLDGTLASFEPGQNEYVIGAPVPASMRILRKHLDSGTEVRIFTARAADPAQVALVRAWMEKHGLPNLSITNKKDYDMYKLYDDRAVPIKRNQGPALYQTPYQAYFSNILKRKGK